MLQNSVFAKYHQTFKFKHLKKIFFSSTSKRFIERQIIIIIIIFISFYLIYLLNINVKPSLS